MIIFMFISAIYTYILFILIINTCLMLRNYFFNYEINNFIKFINIKIKFEADRK